MIMTVTGEDFTVSYNGETMTPVNGVVTTAVKSANPRMPVVLAITGEGTYTVNFTYPEGTMENPAQLVMGSNTATIEAGNSMGYYFTWTAPATGELTITMPEGNWTYAINNMTTYVYGDTQWSDSDPVVNPATVEVNEGDVIQIMVNGYDPNNMWEIPAGDITFTAAFEPAIEKFNVYGANMTLGNDLAMNFFILKANYADGIYAEITKTAANGETKTVKASFAPYGNGALYSVRYDGLAAKEMGDQLSVVIYNAEGQAISNPWLDSVKDYAMRMLPGAKDDIIRTVYVEMLNYGAAAQAQFNYNTENPVNNELTEAQKALGITDVEVKNEQVKDQYCAGSNLSLENQILLNLFFKNTIMTDDSYAIISFTSHEGKDVEVRVEASEYGTQGSFKTVIIDDIVLADSFKVVTVTIYNAEGEVVSTACDSVAGYVARMSQGDDIYMAVAKFAKAAYNNFHR